MIWQNSWWLWKVVRPPMGIWMPWLSSWRWGSLRVAKKNEKMAKQLEETHKQLANQMEKTIYEES
jgi:hypothetical protein